MFKVGESMIGTSSHRDDASQRGQYGKTVKTHWVSDSEQEEDKASEQHTAEQIVNGKFCFFAGFKNGGR